MNKCSEEFICSGDVKYFNVFVAIGSKEALQ